MAIAFTEQIELGYRAPDFILTEPLTGDKKSLRQLKSDVATVVMFICNHCPYVKHINSELVKLAKYYMPKGVSFIAINPNDADRYPEDSPEKMAFTARAENYPFPYLYDPSQQVAKAYKAVCTPDFSIFNKNLECVYRGQLDDSRPGNNKPLTGLDMRNALEDIIVNKAIQGRQIPSSGCSIKWKQLIS